MYQDGALNTSVANQFGNGNVAGSGQQGVNNFADTFQNGNFNQAGVAQFGTNNNSVLSQDGNGNIIAGVQIGDGCSALPDRIRQRSCLRSGLPIIIFHQTGCRESFKIFPGTNQVKIR